MINKSKQHIEKANTIWRNFAAKNDKQAVLTLFKKDSQEPNNLLIPIYSGLHLCLELKQFMLEQLAHQAYKGQTKQLTTKDSKLSKMAQQLSAIPSDELNQLACDTQSLIDLSITICDLYQNICDACHLYPKDLQAIQLDSVIQKYVDLSEYVNHDWYGGLFVFDLINKASLDNEISEVEKNSWLKIYLLSFVFSSEKLDYVDIAATAIDPRIAAIKVSKEDQKRLDGEPDKASSFEKIELLFNLYNEKKQKQSQIEASLLEEETNISTKTATATKTRGRARTKKVADSPIKSIPTTPSTTAKSNKTKNESEKVSTLVASSGISEPASSEHITVVPKSSTNATKTREPSPFVASSRQQTAMVKMKKELSAKRQSFARSQGKWISDYLKELPVPKQEKQTHSIQFKGVATSTNPTKSKNIKKSNDPKGSKSTESKVAQATQTESIASLPPLVSWELQEDLPKTASVAPNSSIITTQNEDQHPRVPTPPSAPNIPQCLFTPSMLVDQQGILWDTAIPPHINVLKTIPMGVQCLWWTQALSRFAATYYSNCIPICYVLDIRYNGCIVVPPLVQSTPIPANQSVFCVLAFYIQTEQKTTYILDADLFGTPITSTKRETNIGEQTGLSTYLAQLKAWQESVSPDYLATVNQERKQQITTGIPIVNGLPIIAEE